MRTHPFSSIVPPSPFSGIVCLSPSRLRKKEHSSSCDLHGVAVTASPPEYQPQIFPRNPVRDLHFHLKPSQIAAIRHAFPLLFQFDFVQFLLCSSKGQVRLPRSWLIPAQISISFLEFTFLLTFCLTYLPFTLGAVARFASSPSFLVMTLKCSSCS